MKVKKLIIVLAPLGILFVVICAVVSLTRPYFPPRPKNTTLEFWICDDVSSVDWNGHDEITGWMGAYCVMTDSGIIVNWNFGYQPMEKKQDVTKEPLISMYWVMP